MSVDRTRQECGMLLDRSGEFHPYVFCVLKKAGRDPWSELQWVVEQLGLTPKLGKRPPLVKDLPSKVERRVVIGAEGE